MQKECLINPTYRFNTNFKLFLFCIAGILLIMGATLPNREVLRFFGLIVLLFGALYWALHSKKSLLVDEEKIVFISKSAIKEFDQSVIIKYSDIKKIHFLKSQFFKIGGSPLGNRMVFEVRNPRYKKGIMIRQVGALNDFKKAHALIISNLKNMR